MTTDTAITIETVETAVCQFYGVNARELHLTRRKLRQELSFCRFLVYYLCVKMKIATKTEIGAFYGKDHTHVLYGQHLIQSRIDTIPAVELNVKTIERNIIPTKYTQLTNSGI